MHQKQSSLGTREEPRKDSSDQRGSEENNDAVTLEMLDELNVIAGIDEISYAIHNTFDIQAALGMVMDFTEGGFGFDEEGAEQQIMNLFNFYSQQWETKYTTYIADMVNFNELDVGFIGVDMDFVNMVDQDMLIWSSPGSNFNSSFLSRTLIFFMVIK